MNDLEKLKEKLAAIEHERWADWQKWLHNKCTEIEDDEGDPLGLMIPAGYVEHLERQIKTPYSDLTDAEKASDMEQVDRYWPLIEALMIRERIDELKGFRKHGMISDHTTKKSITWRIEKLKAQLSASKESHDS